MKRFHVHLSVPDLAASIRFYSGMFGMPPTVEKSDYAKWMLDEPRVNFAISHRGAREGLNHLGLQADSADELADIRGRFEAAERGAVTDELDAHCCYAISDKHWVRDPQGIAWEAFHSLGTIPLYEGACATSASGCCAPADVDESQRAATTAVAQRACCS
ncbi:MAG: ArsI/CadI family heavy metal resistance metalloenzyme [Vicinamibacteria bacterium]